MNKQFDCKGLLFAIKEVQKAYILECIEKLGFCQICLGANVPNMELLDPSYRYPKKSWCCGSWCEHLLPAFKICKRFQLDRKKLKELAESIRPDGTEKTASYSIG